MDTGTSRAESSPLPSSWVEPAGPVDPDLINCSTLDNLTAPVYPSPTEFFPLKENTDPLQIYRDCKHGLARYLFEHPHLCGIIIKDETGRNSIKIQPAPYAGANFEYKDHRDNEEMPSYQAFRVSGWPFADGEQDGLANLRPKDFPNSQHGDPIIAPQFNVIKGGIVLTMSISHAIGDLVQFMDFVGSWARHTCAVVSARMNDRLEPPLPKQIDACLMDRSRLSPSVQIEKNLDKLSARASCLLHLAMLDPREPQKMVEMMGELFTKARLTKYDLMEHSEDDLSRPSCSVWTFPESSIKKIQRITQSASPQNVKLSSVDCLTAFAWQRFFTAKWAADEPYTKAMPETSRIVFAGNIRRRLTPPLPLNYMPTCVDLFPVTINTRDFTSSLPEALARAAMVIRHSNVSWSEGEFHKMLEIAQAHPMNPGLIPRGPIDALVTDHTRATASVLENWGPELGQCEAMREPYLGREIPRGEITLLPRGSNGQVDVMFAGEAVVLARLKKDSHMNTMAACQFVMNDSISSIAKGKDLPRL